MKERKRMTPKQLVREAHDEGVRNLIENINEWLDKVIKNNDEVTAAMLEAKLLYEERRLEEPIQDVD